MGRRVIDGCHEAVWARLDRFCGIYGASSADRWTFEIDTKHIIWQFISPKRFEEEGVAATFIHKLYSFKFVSYLLFNKL